MTQLRALLRAAPAGRLRVMFPFVTSVEEMRGATALMRDAAERVGYAGVPVAVGAMVEVPSAALAADLLAQGVGLLHGGHQRPDSVHAGRRSH